MRRNQLQNHHLGLESDERQRTWKTNNYNTTYTLEAQKMREEKTPSQIFGGQKARRLIDLCAISIEKETLVVSKLAAGSQHPNGFPTACLSS
jgi:hypothetical protein